MGMALKLSDVAKDGVFFVYNIIRRFMQVRLKNYLFLNDYVKHHKQLFSIC